MPLGLCFFVGWMAFVVLIGIIFLVYGVVTGQFKDIEEAKYRMLEDHEPKDWPGRKEENHV